MRTATSDAELRNSPFFRRCLWLGGLGLLLAAIFATGFYHCDEHFQILEFAALKLGLTTESALPWEYGARIRPWLQPAIYVGMAKALSWVGFTNPFGWAAFFRLSSAALAWVGIFLLALCLPRWINQPRWQRGGVLFLFFLFYVPYLYARPSSESLSASLFAVGFGHLCLGLGTERERGALGLAGFFLGLSFQCRFQMGLMIFGLGLWAVAVARLTFKSISVGFLGFALAVSLGVLVDRWGYGEWVVTSARYFMVNLWQNKVSSFGVQPWWYYFKLVAKEILFPHGYLLFLALVYFWVRFPKHPITWMTIPFVAAHVLIAHKETRFIYPLAPFLGVVLAMVMAELATKGVFVRFPKFTRVAGGILIAVNFISYFKLALRPLKPEMPVLSRLYDERTKFPHLFYSGMHPYEFCAGLRSGFFRSPGVEVEPITTLSSLDSGKTLFFRDGYGVPPSLPGRCRLLSGRSIHEWLPEAWRDDPRLKPIYLRNRYVQLFACE